MRRILFSDCIPEQEKWLTDRVGPMSRPITEQAWPVTHIKDIKSKVKQLT